MRTALSPALLRRRIAEGARVVDLATEFGVQRNTIKRHCRLHGIALPYAPPGPRRRAPSTPEILASIAAGETASSIARRAGVSRPAIVRALLRDGYRLSRGRIIRIDEVQS